MDALNMRSQISLFEELVSSNDDVLIDISDVAYIELSGVGGLVFLFQRLREHGHTLKVIGAQGQPLALIRHLRPTVCYQHLLSARRYLLLQFINDDERGSCRGGYRILGL